MKKAQVINVEYRRSESFKFQGTQYEAVRRCKDGFYIQENKNGNFLIVKPAMVIVTIKGSGKSKSFNMKYEICDLYGRKRISKKIVEQFKKDVQNGKIVFFLNSSMEYAYEVM